MYSAGKNDECYTPRYAVEPIFEKALDWVWKQQVYTPPTVWLPFDTEDSEFVKVFRERPDLFKVTRSHISEGKDFFEYEPPQWDILISNPPFTGKRQIFERALSFGKPIALLMSNTWLNDSASKTVFQNAGRNMELLMFDNRIRFNSPDGRPNNKITFSSSYFCSDFLPRDIVLGGKLDIPK